MKRTAILAIDLQNDFTSPTGSLYVSGADNDMKRIAGFILKNQMKIDYIALSLDSHQPIHIAHQIYWKDTKGGHPSLFSIIRAEDVKSGKWTARYNKEKAYPYLRQLEEKGEVCTIWPMHCVLGTEGWALDKTITNTLIDWSIRSGKSYELFYKGWNQSTEHYSIFRAAVEWESSPETKLNKKLLSLLNKYDEVILVGEAADYCVANSLNDIVNECSELAKKIVVLTDCMSWINPDNKRAKDIYEHARKSGVRFEESVNYTL